MKARAGDPGKGKGKGYGVSSGDFLVRLQVAGHSAVVAHIVRVPPALDILAVRLTSEGEDAGG